MWPREEPVITTIAPTWGDRELMGWFLAAPTGPTLIPDNCLAYSTQEHKTGELLTTGFFDGKLWGFKTTGNSKTLDGTSSVSMSNTYGSTSPCASVFVGTKKEASRTPITTKRLSFRSRLNKNASPSVYGLMRPPIRHGDLCFKVITNQSQWCILLQMAAIGKLKSDLDTVFSRYVRLKHADRSGNVTCFTCKKLFHWKKIQNGHYISRNCLATRFDENNCRPQCWGCNGYGRGKPLEFEEGLKRQLGDEFVEEMKRNRHSVTKLTEEWYREKISYYKKLVKELEGKL